VLPETFETARLLLRPVAAVDVAAIFDTYAQDEEGTGCARWWPGKTRPIRPINPTVQSRKAR
jgi:hypothetical protein